MPYTPEELDELASDAAWDGGDIATMMEVFAQAARDARLRQGVERLLERFKGENYLPKHQLRALLAETETP